MNRSKQETILIVDGAFESVAALADNLCTDYRVTFAINGPDALSAALARPSLILLNETMPGMGGYEVFRRLKSDLRTYRIPIIFLTSQADLSNEVLGLSLGAVDFLHQPCDPAIVRQRVRAHLEPHNQNLALEYPVSERNRVFEDTRFEIVHRLRRVETICDNGTGVHVIRMSQYCHRLALAAGIPASRAEQLLLAASMHDIGKIAIPVHILLKPGKLNEEEWAIMHRHAAIGAEIIGNQGSELLALARNVALTHHERWDGTGYPNGLAGEDIPFEGRIAAICDVYDALTSSRPYKRAWSVDEAIEHIVGESGKAFDPILTNIFVALDLD